MKPIVWPYKIGSAGAKELAKALNTKRVRSHGKYKPKPNHVVINWGNHLVGGWVAGAILNHPMRVDLAANKLTALRAMLQGGVNVPKFAVTKEDMLHQLGKFKPIISRYKLRSHGGDGAVYFDTLDAFMESQVAPLYVEYIKKTAEYRVHVFSGKVIDCSIKRKRKDAEVDSKIRNLENGWVFCREEIFVPDEVIAQAVSAVNCLGLDFGAVDVVWNKVRGAFVLEVNTAPGMQGKTVESYATAINKLIGE